MVLPYFHGSWQGGSFYLIDGNRFEGAPSAYAGLIITLLLAPLGFCNRSLRGITAFWLIIGALAACPVLGVPGVSNLFEIGPLQLLKNNRFTMLTGWAAVAMAVAGMEVLWRRQRVRRWWFCLPVIMLLVVGGWCALRALKLPEPVANELAQRIHDPAFALPYQIDDMDDIHRIQRRFMTIYAVGAALCTMTIIIWIALWRGRISGAGGLVTVAGLVAAELIWTSWGVNAQCDPALYYPRIGVMEQIARRGDGRICGMRNLPANLNMSHDLLDIRGYDGADPRRLVELLNPVRSHLVPAEPHAMLQRFTPSPEPSPILDMLNMRYQLFRRNPGVDTLIAQDDYWVVENPTAMPRVYVPRHVKGPIEARQTLALLTRPDFNPAEVVYVDRKLNTITGECVGEARIVAETPSRVTIDASMQTSGVVVLADSWDKGWRAYLDGHSVPVLRANYVLRGVEAPAGKSTIVLSYEPTSMTIGLWLMMVGLFALAAWVVVPAMIKVKTPIPG
jgi:hypothetical protein